MKIVAKCGENEVNSNVELLKSLKVGDIFVYNVAVYMKCDSSTVVKIGTTNGSISNINPLGQVHSISSFADYPYKVEPKPNAMLVLN